MTKNNKEFDSLFLSENELNDLKEEARLEVEKETHLTSLQTMTKSQITKKIRNAKRRLKQSEKMLRDDPDGEKFSQNTPIADIKKYWVPSMEEEIKQYKIAIQKLAEERKKRSGEKKDLTRQIRNAKRRLKRLKENHSSLEEKGLIPAEPGSDAELVIACMENEILQNDDLIEQIIKKRSTL
jgi:DNA repair exonuclease SbcCD ATPase subunit